MGSQFSLFVVSHKPKIQCIHGVKTQFNLFTVSHRPTIQFIRGVKRVHNLIYPRCQISHNSIYWECHMSQFNLFAVLWLPGFLPGAKWPGRGINALALSNPEVKNESMVAPNIFSITFASFSLHLKTIQFTRTTQKAQEKNEFHR
jgi:hypothetical protein